MAATLLATAIKNPIKARLIPITWILFNFSFKKIRAKTTITTISSGPAIRTSFEAPILLIESYHVNIPVAKEKQAKNRFFHDLESSIAVSLLFIRKVAVTNSVIPAKVMLMAESIIEGILRKVVVKNSMRIDSTDIVIA